MEGSISENSTLHLDITNYNTEIDKILLQNISKIVVTIDYGRSTPNQRKDMIKRLAVILKSQNSKVTDVTLPYLYKNAEAEIYPILINNINIQHLSIHIACELNTLLTAIRDLLTTNINLESLKLVGMVARYLSNKNDDKGFWNMLIQSLVHRASYGKFTLDLRDLMMTFNVETRNVLNSLVQINNLIVVLPKLSDNDGEFPMILFLEDGLESEYNKILAIVQKKIIYADSLFTRLYSTHLKSF